jgi:hypothetical protein
MFDWDARRRAVEQMATLPNRHRRTPEAQRAHDLAAELAFIADLLDDHDVPDAHRSRMAKQIEQMWSAHNGTILRKEQWVMLFNLIDDVAEYASSEAPPNDPQLNWPMEYLGDRCEEVMPGLWSLIDRDAMVATLKHWHRPAGRPKGAKAGVSTADLKLESLRAALDPLDGHERYSGFCTTLGNVKKLYRAWARTIRDPGR